MISIVLIITANVIGTIIGLRALRSQAEAEKFLFIPHALAQGRNIQGTVLSHVAHTGYGHLFFNMLSFFFFAPTVAKMMGAIGLWTVYILSAVGADLLTFLLRRNDPGYACLGASGSVTGVIFAAIVLNPYMNIFFFLIPIPIPGPIFALLYIALSLYFMKQEGAGISHESHIGGALAGFAIAALLSERGLGPLLERIREFL